MKQTVFCSILVLVTFLDNSSAISFKCGNSRVNPKHTLCCNGLVYVRSGFLPACCGSVGYDGRHYRCCGRTLVRRHNNKNQCCGEQPYNAIQYRCKDGYVEPKTNLGSTCCQTEQGWKCCLKNEGCCTPSPAVGGGGGGTQGSGSAIDVPGFRPACCRYKSQGLYQQAACCAQVMEKTHVLPTCCDGDRVKPICCGGGDNLKCCSAAEGYCCGDKDGSTPAAPRTPQTRSPYTTAHPVYPYPNGDGHDRRPGGHPTHTPGRPHPGVGAQELGTQAPIYGTPTPTRRPYRHTLSPTRVTDRPTWAPATLAPPSGDPPTVASPTSGPSSTCCSSSEPHASCCSTLRRRPQCCTASRHRPICCYTHIRIPYCCKPNNATDGGSTGRYMGSGRDRGIERDTGRERNTGRDTSYNGGRYAGNGFANNVCCDGANPQPYCCSRLKTSNGQSNHQRGGQNGDYSAGHSNGHTNKQPDHHNTDHSRTRPPHCCKAESDLVPKPDCCFYPDRWHHCCSKKHPRPTKQPQGSRQGAHEAHGSMPESHGMVRSSCCSSSVTEECCSFATSMSLATPYCCTEGEITAIPTIPDRGEIDRHREGQQAGQSGEAHYETSVPERHQTNGHHPHGQGYGTGNGRDKSSGVQLGQDHGYTPPHPSCCGREALRRKRCCKDMYITTAKVAHCCVRSEVIIASNIGHVDLDPIPVPDSHIGNPSVKQSCCGLSYIDRDTCCREGAKNYGDASACCDTWIPDETRKDPDYAAHGDLDPNVKVSCCALAGEILDTCCYNELERTQVVPNCCPEPINGLIPLNPETLNGDHLAIHGRPTVAPLRGFGHSHSSSLTGVSAASCCAHMTSDQRNLCCREEYTVSNTLALCCSKHQVDDLVGLNGEDSMAKKNIFISEFRGLCNGISYDMTLYICCAGHLKARTGHIPMCCGSAVYDAVMNQCCDGVVRITCEDPKSFNTRGRHRLRKHRLRYRHK